MSHWWNKKKLTSKVFGDVQVFPIINNYKRYTQIYILSLHTISLDVIKPAQQNSCSRRWVVRASSKSIRTKTKLMRSPYICCCWWLRIQRRSVLCVDYRCMNSLWNWSRIVGWGWRLICYTWRWVQLGWMRCVATIIFQSRSSVCT